ncbi:MAG TPA: alpha/beta fold hydrolase [Thermotogota bacterium]|mgnify:CR=1 FL=1|jgi:pimeloyl-ACP methyl ester carboxylesterase|nr:alpha/beta fold hydrolase [Thermotogota bacterium]NLH19739.1 alpha/beta fold hydrolase [Thermotogaceae bacterium]HNW47188.1 alpha/beta fold hydrolase [Thermotogota bacterium]HNY81991.1 alpha/beta fold hydrolase [Thermotogota bacterium]HOD90940.1 alpha/beta fold hydrolase [Thermotogota bacterium]
MGVFLALRDGGSLYYETFGAKGDWIVFLNGIMMSVPSWKDFTGRVSKHFRLLLVDFRDQGQSSKRAGPYQCAVHVPDLVELFDHLGIESVHMMGVSYGGQVALEFCRAHQNRLKTLELVTVLPKVSNYLVAMGEGWEVAAALNDGARFFSLTIPSIYSDTFYAQRLEWLKNRQNAFRKTLTPEWFEAFIRLSQSANRFDCEDVLPTIRVPTLVLCAEKDILTPAKEMKEMAKLIPSATVLEIPDAGHAAFLEKPEAFLTAIIGYIKSRD